MRASCVALTRMTRWRLGRVVVIVVAWLLFGLYGVAYESLFLTNFPGIYESGLLHNYTPRGALVTTLLTSAVVGGLIATLEVFVLSRRLRRRSFGRALLLRGMIYVLLVLLTCAIGSLVFNSLSSGQPPLSAYVLGEVQDFLLSPSLLYLFMPISVVVFLTLAVLQISDIFGPGMLPRFIAGQYFEPAEEFRVFMFLDVKSSTTLAESMGNLKYFRFINQFIEDVAPPIHEHNGEIYKYVGDEIIISWTAPYARSCIPCFHAVEDAIAAASARYLETYGHVPEFKAGAHCGQVIVGEIGVLKKEIMYSGDVLNTTARIQALCNEYGHALLISEDILALDPGERYTLEEFDALRLRGKLSATRIFGVTR